MTKDIPVSILEFNNGRFVCEWEGIAICAHHHHTHTALIKALIYHGQPLPYSDEKITFDLAPDSQYEICMNDDASGRTSYSIRKIREKIK